MEISSRSSDGRREEGSQVEGTTRGMEDLHVREIKLGSVFKLNEHGNSGRVYIMASTVGVARSLPLVWVIRVFASRSPAAILGLLGIINADSPVRR